MAFHVHVCVCTGRGQNQEGFGCLVCFLRFRFENLWLMIVLWGRHSSCGVSKRSLMYGLVVLLSLKLSSDLYPNAGLAVVAPMCTCQFNDMSCL